MLFSKLRRLRLKTPRFRVLYILLAAVVIFAIYVSRQIGAMIIKQSEWIITDSIAILVNDAIYSELEESGTDYTDIITINTDSEGNITALTTNMAYINRLQTRIVNIIYELIPDAETEVIDVPIGNILGSKLFAGADAYIPVKVLSVTNVNPSFSGSFSSAGINQTRHRINLHINIELSVLVPGYSGIANVDTDVVIAETVIVGKVPDTYIDFN